MLLYFAAAVHIVGPLVQYAYAFNNETVDCCENQVELVAHLRSNGYIKSDNVAEVMTLIDRKYYFSENPYQINETGDNPAHMHAFALETLKDQLKPGNKVLDIGHESGYLTACMALMVGASGTTVGLEDTTEMMKLAQECVSKDPILKSKDIKITFTVGDLKSGLEEHSPYDAIHVGPSTHIVPESLVEQMNVMGRLLIPLPYGKYLEEMTVYDKDNEGDVVESRISGNFHTHRHLQ